MFTPEEYSITFSAHICCTHWLLCRSKNQCRLCEDFSTPTFQLLIQHVGQVHSKSSDFHLTCGVDNSQTTYTNFAAFKRHLRKKHRSCLHETLLTSEIQTCGSFQEEDEDLSVDEGYLWVMILLFKFNTTLKCFALQACFWLSWGKDEDWSTLDTSSERRSQTYPVVRWGAAGWCHWFVFIHSESIKNAGLLSLERCRMTYQALMSFFSQGHPTASHFTNLTLHRQLTFYTSHFNYVVSFLLWIM